MYSHATDFTLISREALSRFYTMRLLRVYPLHFVVLLLILAFVTLNPSFVEWSRTLPSDTDGIPFSLPGFLQALTLTNRIGLAEQGTWNGPSWSLSSEMLGYAVFPFVAYGLLRVRLTRSCYALAAVALAAFSSVLYIRGHIGVPRMAFCFFAGTALGRAQQLQDGEAYWAAALTNVSGITALLLLITPGLQPLSVFAFAGLIYGLSLSGSVTEELFSSRLVMFLGRISFSLYLTHFVLLHALVWKNMLTRNVIIDLAGLAAICLLAATSAYWLIEKPSHNLARRFGQQRWPSGPTVPAAV